MKAQRQSAYIDIRKCLKWGCIKFIIHFPLTMEVRGVLHNGATWWVKAIFITFRHIKHAGRHLFEKKPRNNNMKRTISHFVHKKGA